MSPELIERIERLFAEWRALTGDQLSWYDGGHNANLKQRTKEAIRELWMAVQK